MRSKKWGGASQEHKTLQMIVDFVFTNSPCFPSALRMGSGEMLRLTVAGAHSEVQWQQHAGVYTYARPAVEMWTVNC